MSRERDVVVPDGELVYLTDEENHLLGNDFAAMHELELRKLDEGFVLGVELITTFDARGRAVGKKYGRNVWMRKPPEHVA